LRRACGFAVQTSARFGRLPLFLYARRMSTVGELMTREVLAVEPSDTIGEAAQKMVEAGVSSVAVSDYGRLIGILTERDLTRAVAGRTHSSEARVREWMTPEPITVTESTPAEEAATLMFEHGFRHLPVVDDERTIGIVSMRDLARWSVGAEKTASS
jgi:CBS domain-containing protein